MSFLKSLGKNNSFDMGHTHTHTHTHAHTHTNAHAYICAHTHTQTHAYTCTYTHTLRSSWPQVTLYSKARPFMARQGPLWYSGVTYYRLASNANGKFGYETASDSADHRKRQYCHLVDEKKTTQIVRLAPNRWQRTDGTMSTVEFSHITCMHVWVCTFMCGGLREPPKQYVAIHRMTSANDASLESALDNRIMDYLTVFELVTMAVYEFPLSQEKMKCRIIRWPALQLLSLIYV